jgi:caa(3)-type oxidase subunit IV
MSATTPLTRREGFIVYSVLIILTLFEVGIVMAGIPKAAGALLMLGTTAGKVMLIVLYFMHMKSDKPLAWLLPAIPVALAVFFVIMLFPDLVYHLPLRFH